MPSWSRSASPVVRPSTNAPVKIDGCWAIGVGKVRPLERELHRVRRGDNHPTSTPAELGVALLELIRHVERAGRTRDHAALECTAVAAIEEAGRHAAPGSAASAG